VKGSARAEKGEWHSKIVKSAEKARRVPPFRLGALVVSVLPFLSFGAFVYGTEGHTHAISTHTHTHTHTHTDTHTHTHTYTFTYTHIHTHTSI
jgi:hypothetical protein